MSSRASSSGFQIVAGLVLTVSLAIALLSTWNWPLVGDASLIHYAVFLMEHGMRPYRELVDINLPGSYLFESAAMHLLGPGAFAWRLYDLLLLLSLGVASSIMARSVRTGVLVGSIFALVHLQDGLAQAGQRDLLLAVLLAGSYAALFLSQRGHAVRRMLFLASFCIGLTLIIKPTFFLLGPLLAYLSARKSGQWHPMQKFAIWSAGLLLPIFGSALWLASQGSLDGFSKVATTLIPLHAELGRRSFGFLLAHATSPITPLVIVWGILVCLLRPQFDLERVELYAGVALAFFSYAEQGKGFPYQRYPLVFFLIFLVNLDFLSALRTAGIQKAAAVAALSFECLLLAPYSAWLVHSFIVSQAFNEALAASLHATNIPLDRNVQCLDTFGGCINTLYDMQLVQRTGFLYDCYLYPRAASTNARNNSDAYQVDLIGALERDPPGIFVMTDELCFSNPRNYERLNQAPRLKSLLASQYVLAEDWRPAQKQKWWSRPEYPDGFRVYLRKDLSAP